MLTGKTIKADKAKKMGLIDLLVAPLGPGKYYNLCHENNTTYTFS